MIEDRKHFFFSVLKDAVLAFLYTVWFILSMLAFVVLWVYTQVGMEFFMPGSPMFKFVVQLVAFLLVGQYCYRAGTTFISVWQWLRTKLGGTNASENKAKE